MKTIVISNNLHDGIKKHCRKNELKLNEYIESILSNHLNFTLEKKSVLPQILKNSKGDVVDEICCTFLSPEFKNNLPKELTLLRNVGETGFIANYTQK